MIEMFGGKWIRVDCGSHAVDVYPTTIISPVDIFEGWEMTDEKWRLLKAAVGQYADHEYISITTGGRRTCGLCRLYNNNPKQTADDCVGCPIYKHTHMKYCHGTPNGAVDNHADGINVAALKQLIDQEIELLDMAK